ncbi:hypothetical protein F4778DRAFT_745820 [Xylariomycetidae sp. FL2044]|nr:hypothetical protein F4778DRAFT_745820 [Xylariomycetidae sp. FL2044]
MRFFGTVLGLAIAYVPIATAAWCECRYTNDWDYSDFPSDALTDACCKQVMGTGAVYRWWNSDYCDAGSQDVNKDNFRNCCSVNSNNFGLCK